MTEDPHNGKIYMSEYCFFRDVFCKRQGMLWRSHLREKDNYHSD